MTAEMRQENLRGHARLETTVTALPERTERQRTKGAPTGQEAAEAYPRLAADARDEADATSREDQTIRWAGTNDPPQSDHCRSQMLTLAELCQWLNITERHARKLVERGDIPYRKIGRLLRFCEADINEWSRPSPHHERTTAEESRSTPPSGSARPAKRNQRSSVRLPKSLLD
jgi:excisionase family DNA binding protein